jgi:hypothetical protein
MKIVAFPKEWLQSLLIPHRELLEFLPVPPVAIQLATALVFLAFAVHFFYPVRRASLQELCSPSTAALLLLLGITILPYLFRPTGWTWHSRYLYFPTAAAAPFLAVMVSNAWTLRIHRGKLSKAMLITASIIALYVLVLNAWTVDFMFGKIQMVGIR